MGDIVKKMRNEVPEGFNRFKILLPTHMTVLSIDKGIAVQAILFYTLLKMTQCSLFLLKLVKFYQQMLRHTAIGRLTS